MNFKLHSYLKLHNVKVNIFSKGLAISAYVNSESFALELAIALVYPVLLSAGMSIVFIVICKMSLLNSVSIQGLLWPLQSLPDWVRYTCYSFPMAVPTDAVRSILLRGEDLVICCTYSIICAFITFIVIIVTIKTL